MVNLDLLRFVDINKNFLGKDALLKRKTEVSCVTLLIDGPKGFIISNLFSFVIRLTCYY